MPGSAPTPDDTAPSPPDRGDAARSSIAHPASIGDYAVLDVLGEGGMGTVYLAEQRGALRRKVAIKAIKPGMDTREVVARFDAERQALARLGHPNIAQVYDAGSTPEGRPYFVMEYVPGPSLTDFCDREALGIDARLRMFADVCRGVHHANERGIVHRDIKPSNVLVQEDGASAIPKVIDFGVAKALDHGLTEKTLMTEHGQILGTPEYMSPEQANKGAPVDARSDVYSLGVLLYELLTGTLPFDTAKMRSGGYQELHRHICEIEPETPSRRLTTSLELGRESASKRRTSLANLLRELRGDLDWIVMRALHKEPGRRYQSARELAEDTDRHLRGERVLAGPPSIGYRLARTWARHRRTITALVALALLGVVATLYVTELRRNIALRDQLDSLTGRTRAAAEALPVPGGAVDVASQRRVGAADVRAIVRDALPDLAKIVELRERTTGPESSETAESLRRLAQARLAVEDYAGALPLFERCAAIHTRIGDARDPRAALALNDLAACQQQSGDYRGALANYERALTILRELHPGDDPRVATALGNVASVMASLGDTDRARARLEEVLAMRERLYRGDHPAVQSTREQLAQLRVSGADAPGAIALMHDGIAANVRGHDPEKVFDAGAGLARTLRATGDLQNALDLQLRLLQDRLRIAPDGDPRVQASKLDVADTLLVLGNLETAAELQRQVLTARETLRPEDLPGLVDARRRLATTLLRRGDLEKARALQERVVGDLSGTVPADNPDLLDGRAALAQTLARAGELESAIGAMIEVLRARRHQLGAQHPETAAARAFVTTHLAELERTDPAAAARLRERTRAIDGR